MTAARMPGAEDKTVVVVDDEEAIRESLRDVLEDEGYRVLVAANGREALEHLAAISPPCAVILDIIMPIMSGTEVYEAMQADPRLAAIPLVVATSDPSRAPSGVLTMRKPFDVERVLSGIAALFRAF